MDSLTLDGLDRQLVHALTIDGRAPFSHIADVLNRSDRTVAHRYRRLRAAGLRVVGQVDWWRLGWVTWLVRLRCAPEGASPIAAALSRRDDTAWVGVASGGTEITCITRARHGRDHLLLEKLSRTRRINDVTAQCLLRPVAGTAGWQGRTSALESEQIERMRTVRGPQPAADTGEPVNVDLSETDWALLRALATDGRTGYPRLAAVTGWSESTTRRRLTELHGDGILSFDVDIQPHLLGYTCQAALWLTVAPAQLTTVTHALAKHPEIAYAAATTGVTNVVAFAVCQTLDALYDYLANRIGGLSGVLQVETSPITRQVKRAGAVDT